MDRRWNLLSSSSTVSHYLHERQSEATPRFLSKAIPAMCAHQNSSVQAREEVVHLFPRSRRRKRTSEAESDDLAAARGATCTTEGTTDSVATAAVGSKNGKDADFQGPSVTPAITLAPRRKRAPSSFSRDIIEPYLTMPLAQAAAALGLSVSSLKRICRRIGIDRWPYQRPGVHSDTRDETGISAKKQDAVHVADASLGLGAARPTPNVLHIPDCPRSILDGTRFLSPVFVPGQPTTFFPMQSPYPQIQGTIQNAVAEAERIIVTAHAVAEAEMIVANAHAHARAIQTSTDTITTGRHAHGLQHGTYENMSTAHAVAEAEMIVANAHAHARAIQARPDPHSLQHGTSENMSPSQTTASNLFTDATTSVPLESPRDHGMNFLVPAGGASSRAGQVQGKARGEPAQQEELSEMDAAERDRLQGIVATCEAQLRAINEREATVKNDVSKAQNPVMKQRFQKQVDALQEQHAFSRAQLETQLAQALDALGAPLLSCDRVLQ